MSERIEIILPPSVARKLREKAEKLKVREQDLILRAITSIIEER